MKASELICSPGTAIADAASTSHAPEEQQDHASLGCSLGHSVVGVAFGAVQAADSAHSSVVTYGI